MMALKIFNLYKVSAFSNITKYLNLIKWLFKNYCYLIINLNKMTQLLLSENLCLNENSDCEEIQDIIENAENYKGIYHNDEEEESEKYFEGGAHFPYETLYFKLEEIKKQQQLEIKNAAENNFKKNKLVNSRDSIMTKGIYFLRKIRIL